MEIVYILYLVVGVLSGVLGGLLGMGGGVIAVPCLFYIFRAIGLHPPFFMHEAIATSLSAMVLNTAASAWAHHRGRQVVWAVLKQFAPGLILGSVLGATLAHLLSGVILEVFFGLFLCLLAVHFYRQKAIVKGPSHLPSRLALLSFAAAIGSLSNLLGIGGGSVAVPLFTSFKMKDIQAIGTSAAVSFITTVCGALSYLYLGWQEFPQEPLGLIDPAAFCIVGLSAFFTAPLGAALTCKIEAQKVRKLFAWVLLFTGLLLVF